jgi:hypothetical protein
MEARYRQQYRASGKDVTSPLSGLRRTSFFAPSELAVYILIAVSFNKSVLMKLFVNILQIFPWAYTILFLMKPVRGAANEHGCSQAIT